MSHIALSHTPFHLLQLGIIAEQLAARDETLEIFHEGPIAISIPGLQHARIVELPGATGYADGRTTLRENARRILEEGSWRRSTVMYASDLKWLTNNLVYFSRPSAVRRAQTTLITDGLGSYLRRQDRLRTIVTSMTKMALGALGYGPKHLPLPRNHFGLDHRYVSAVIGFNPDRIIGDLPKIGLTVPKSEGDVAPACEDSLVIGVPLDPHRFTRAKALDMVEQMAAAAISRTPTAARLAYKPHHFEQDWIRRWYTDAGFDVIGDVRPAELVIRELRFRRIFGTYSSVLAFGPQYAVTECQPFSVCFDDFAGGYLDGPDREELRRLLTDFGVTFL